MNSNLSATLTAGAMLVAAGSLQASIVQDGSFETSISGGINYYGNTLRYQPTSPDWTFFAGAGTQMTGDSGTVFQEPTPGTLPDGSQHFAFVQGVGSYISQTINLPTSGLYKLTYDVAGRNSGEPYAGALTYQVVVGSTTVTTDATTDYQPWTGKSIVFYGTAGLNTLEFLGTATPAGLSQDQTALFDSVAVTAVPEPSTWVAGVGMLLGFSGMLFRRKA